MDNMSRLTIAMLPTVKMLPGEINIQDAGTSRSINNESRKWTFKRALKELISNSHDSDGKNVPLSILPESEEEYQEHPLSSLVDLEELEPQTALIDCQEDIIISTEYIMKLEVNELRSKLKKRGLRIKGQKTELQKNLI